MQRLWARNNARKRESIEINKKEDWLKLENIEYKQYIITIKLYKWNCSSFTSKMCNKNAEYKVSAGIVNTPTNLKNSILDDAGGNYRIGHS